MWIGVEVGESSWGANLARFERMMLELSRSCWLVT